MTGDCIFSRQVEGYLDCQKQEKIPRFLEEHYESCSKCKEKFVEKGHSFQQIESFIPFFSLLFVKNERSFQNVKVK